MRNKKARIPDFNSFVSNAGDKFHVLYDSFFSDDGTIRLKESSRVNIQAEINSHLAETDMAIIVSRLQLGDTSVLTQKKPMYGDFTQFPKTYAEAFDMVKRSEYAFEALSPDIKQKFDNDVGKWFSSIGTDSWIENMGFLVTPEQSESEVVE